MGLNLQWIIPRIDLSDIPGGPTIFEKVAKFCYGVNFEITVQNVADLRCAAEFLQMTDQYCGNNLTGRTEDFLSQVAFFTLTGAVIVLKSCRQLLPYAEDLNIVKRCVEAVSAKACSKANFPSRSQPHWWTKELAVLDIDFFQRVIAAMKQRGAKSLTLGRALITYTERALKELVQDHSGNGIRSSDHGDSDSRSNNRKLLESIVDLFPSEKATFPIHLLCCLLYCVTYLRASNACKNELEKRISSILEHATVDDLLVLSFTYDGEKLFDPNLDEIEREVCSVMDPLKLSYEARVHASQNKRLPVQIVLHALYYDQLRLRSSWDECNASAERTHLQADVSLVRENKELRSELMKMKMYILDMQKNGNGQRPGTTSSASTKKTTFFSCVSKKLGKLNPLRNGSKDTTHIENGYVDLTKPRRRRFSVS